ncbi:MAG: zinc-dependent alcohol dehydrogenase family protein [Acidobacteria bacterium]|uniref:Zinc-dependent alcohol dehydrogenase family protein n=1 Tax=Candidatus Polarisedimenticola svalbardensis TaxID=2886004 RepID=A0A8J7C253_9BACT|nr:zinc-dependent alcohol dehydrogenase family protein [Candidatus Polarisedimenticola svalbardensis]
MKAVYYETFGGDVTVRDVPDPSPPVGGVVLKVEATGLCRSDWHGWMGHDPDIRLPHVPGHELAGTVEEVGAGVSLFQRGDRVTLPFVCGCGDCPQCDSGNQQVCDHQFQPGFTHWGSFAEYVAVRYADVNLVRLPEQIDSVTAASLGCRFITSYRAVVAQGRVREGEWVAVHGCGGVGLSAVMIARALGARVVAVDIGDDKLEFARKIGAEAVVDAGTVQDVVEAIREITSGGAHVSVDGLGHPDTCFNSVACLRKRGRHVQVGLMTGDHQYPAVPMDQVIAGELEILGSHGMQAHRFPEMLEMIREGRLHPELLIGRTISLGEAPAALTEMDKFSGTGITVIDRFS